MKYSRNGILWLGSLGAACLVTMAIKELRGNVVAETRATVSPSVTVSLLNSQKIFLMLYLARPRLFGVASWSIGDIAKYSYSYRPEGPDSEVTTSRIEVQVVAAAQMGERALPCAEDAKYWIRTAGFRTWRDIPGEMYSLVSRERLWFGQTTPTYERNHRSYFPIRNRDLEEHAEPQIVWSEEGNEDVSVGSGHLPCIKRRGRWPGLVDDMIVWTNNTAGPLGVVRMQVGDDLLALQECGSAEPEGIDKAMRALFEGRVEYGGKCIACHPNVDFHRLHEWLR